MPCISEYLSPNELEKEGSVLLCLLDELNTGRFNKLHFKGYHPLIYTHFPTKEYIDSLTKRLCGKLKTINDISKYSLELQMWWRDHKHFDEQREKKEKFSNISNADFI